MLGLEQLLAITDEKSKYREKGLKYFEVSINKSCWYLFAVCGINITKKLLKTLKDQKHEPLSQAIIHHWQFLEDDFYKRRTVSKDAYMTFHGHKDTPELRHEKQIKVENFFKQECVLQDLFNYLYLAVLSLFCDHWVDVKHDIMRFNQFLNHFIFDEVFLPQSVAILEGYIKMRKSKKD